MTVGASGAFYLAYIGLPDGSPAALGKAGCANEVATSPTGASFSFINHAALCPNAGASSQASCFPDWEHIAADPTTQVNGKDQVYLVYRNFTFTVPARGSCFPPPKGNPDPTLVCSADGGATWTSPLAVGSGDFAHVMVGPDSFVYVVYRDGDSIMVNKFSSCGSGLVQQPDFPVEVVDDVNDVDCPVPGLDRCDEDLGVPTLAVDPHIPDHLTVAYVNNTSNQNENVMVQDSYDGGLTWDAPGIVNAAVKARRFLPWVCAEQNATFVGWYDRRAATAQQNDRTDYFVGVAGDNTIRPDSLGPEFKISTNADPQCLAGWGTGKFATRDSDDSESCSQSEQPQFAGQCSGDPTTSCDFSDGCPVGKGSCQTGNGIPKYGDYNGFACANGRIFAAWASATPQGGIAPSGIQVFTAALNPPTLRVQESIVVQGGGGGIPDVFVVTIDTEARGRDLGDGSGVGPAVLAPGTHTVGQGTSQTLPKFTTAFGGDCAADGTVTLAFGDTKSCTITNTFSASSACAAGCLVDRDACFAAEGQPGAETHKECVQDYKICLNGC